MLMHMPKKVGIPAMLIVAACLGAYWGFVVKPVRAGDWEIYQGTGKEVFRDGQGRYVDISYTVRDPGRPLFRCAPVRGARAEGDNAGNGELRIAYLSEWPATLRIVVEDKDGTAFEAHLALASGEDAWKQEVLPGECFQRVHPATGQGLRAHPDFRRLRPKVLFYDGSGVRRPSTRFSNHVRFEAVILQ